MSQKERKQSRRRPGSVYDTDIVAREVFLSLLRDFRSNYFHFREGIDKSSFSDMEALRTTIDDFSFDGTSVGRFKAHHQIACFLKKYRFKHDVYSDDQLKTLTYSKFFAEQERISSVSLSEKFRIVLRRARSIARSILGKYSEDEHLALCKFGTNSSIGCPLSIAHIDVKLSREAAFTGSSAVASWFKTKVFDEDQILRDTFRSMSRVITWHETTLRTEFLVLKDVPKTWKTLRVITPLPLLDLYYSNGYGSYVTERLDSHGLRIANLQQKHRRLVERMSRDLRHVTADLSSASDSITCQLLNAILPRDWYVALKPLLQHNLRRGEAKYYTASVLPMGNGATFPVETLVFYSLIKAIGTLAGIDGVYSVYGDDLIYPSRVHRYVANVFPKLGLLLNPDKTYVSRAFRESCGSDYYRGVDVRPFFLKGSHRLLTRAEYIVYLHKVVNGIQRRWHRLELPTTFRWLFIELLAVSGTICRVPPSYPDTAGVHVSSPSEILLEEDPLSASPILKRFRDGTGQFTFVYMRERAPNRFVLFEMPYYWQTLSGTTDHQRSWKITDEAPRPQFTFVAVPTYKSYYRKGRMIRKKSLEYKPCVCEKNLTNVQLNTGTVTDWI